MPSLSPSLYAYHKVILQSTPQSKLAIISLPNSVFSLVPSSMQAAKSFSKEQCTPQNGRQHHRLQSRELDSQGQKLPTLTSGYAGYIDNS
mmetsp:Transcript_39239/g.72208  ORF Transcript_39239/g.72208 Transcript_39239/m.72208 type:complete len:90 (-) Transcript_39239:89-358(-)